MKIDSTWKLAVVSFVSGVIACATYVILDRLFG